MQSLDKQITNITSKLLQFTSIASNKQSTIQIKLEYT